MIVPVHSGGERFHANMDSIRRAEPPPDEVIVIGDGDTDGSSQFAEAAGITVYRFPTPKGPSFARNLGASKAMSELLLSVDVAGTVPENVTDRERDLLARNSDVAAIGSYGYQQGSRILLSQYRKLVHYSVHQNGREEASMFWGAYGVACLFILNYGAR